MKNNAFEVEYIMCAAIHFDDGNEHIHQPRNIESGFVICGHRHHNCNKTAAILDPSRSYKKFKKTEGFITNKNRFVDRNDAIIIAIDAGQIDHPKYSDTSLYSEDLY